MSSDLLRDVAAELDLAFGGVGSPITHQLPSFDLSEPSTHSDPHHRDRSAQEDADDVEEVAASPVHPIPGMQNEFEESILDSMAPHPTRKPLEKVDAETRRRQLLELKDPTLDEAYSARWRQKPGAKYHPLRKLVAQISYGIHLLDKDSAKSNEEVMVILQGHVDEIDSFVEDTVADFDLATEDIDERIEHLTLPLEHSRTFNRMLCDRVFRDTILEGNEIIERIIDRTMRSMNRSLEDVQNGTDAAKQLSNYLEHLHLDWLERKPDLMDVYEAMKGNTTGWLRCFAKLQAKAADLKRMMLRLGYIVDEVAKRCGIASRRKTPTGVIAERQSTLAAPIVSPRHFEKPLPPPPSRISINPAGSPRAPSTRSRPSSSSAHRPSVSSTPSAQTLDCLHRPPQRSNPEADRPSSSSSHTKPVRFPGEVIPSSSYPRSQSYENSPATSQQPRYRPAARSPLSHNITRQATMPALSPGSGSAPARDITSTTPINRPRTSSATQNSGIVGLGIETAPTARRLSIVSTGSSSTIVKAHSSAASTVTDSASRHPPSTSSAPSLPYPTTESLDLRMPAPPPLRSTRSFSIFPQGPGSTRAMSITSTASKRSPALTPWIADNRQSTTSLSSVAVHVDDTDSASGSTGDKPFRYAPVVTIDPADKFLVHKTPRSGYAASDYAISTYSDVPTLSTSHHPSSSSATDSTNAASISDGLFDALRSHPVNQDLLPPTKPHNYSTSITALPRFPSRLGISISTGHLPLSPSEEDTDHLAPPDLKKRPNNLAKKSSFASMRVLFAKKPGGKDARYLGPSGVGGCVTLE